MICQMLQRCVEQFGRQHATARQQHKSPPHRLYSEHDQHNHNGYKSSDLNSEVALASPGRSQTHQGESKPVNERLVLVDGHPVYFTAPEMSVAMTRSILGNSCDPRFGSPMSQVSLDSSPQSSDSIPAVRR